MNNRFNIEALRAWFESCDVGKEYIWILYRGTTIGKNNWISTFEREGASCDEAFDALMQALQQQESMNSTRKFMVKFKTSKTDPSPKTTPLEIKPQQYGYGQQASPSASVGIYGTEMFNRFQSINTERLGESIRGIEQKYEAQLRHFQEKNDLERKIERLEDQLESHGSSTLAEKVIDRCMPLLEVLASNMGQAIAAPPVGASVGRLTENVEQEKREKQTQNPPSQQRRQQMPDFNKVVIAVMKLKRVEPNAEQLLIDLSELALQKPELIGQLKQFMNAISEK